MQAALIALGVVLALWAIHRLLSYAEDRGWVYYRRKRGSYGGLGVTSNFLNMYDPSRKHLQFGILELIEQPKDFRLIGGSVIGDGLRGRAFRHFPGFLHGGGELGLQQLFFRR
jgi:hypothetical protein